MFDMFDFFAPDGDTGLESGKWPSLLASHGSTAADVLFLMVERGKGVDAQSYLSLKNGRIIDLDGNLLPPGHAAYRAIGQLLR